MAANVLTGRVQITAPGAVQLFDNLGKGLSKLQQQVTAFGGGVQKFNSAFSNLKNPINQTSTGLNNLTKTSSSATTAMINLGRVVQDAPFGFLGIANNLNPLLESFQRLKTQTGSTGTALKALGASLTGPAGVGIGLSVVSSLLIVFGDKLLGTSVSFSKAELSAARFEVALSKLKSEVIDLKDQLDFENKLEKLALQFSNLSGGALSAALGGVDISTNVKLVQGLTEKINLLKGANDKLKSSVTAQQEAFIKFTGKVSPLAKLFLQFGDDIPKNIAEKLSKGEQAILSQFQKTNEELKALNKARVDAIKAIGVSPLQGALDIRADKIRLEKPKSVEFKERVLEIPDKIRVEIKDLVVDTSSLRIGGPIGAFDETAKRIEAQLKPIRDQLLKLKELGEFVGNRIANAFESAFSAIGRGENPIRALGEALKQLVLDLIQAALRAFIVKAIVNALAPGVGEIANLGGLGGLLQGIPGFAAGGPIRAGQLAVVGENGPELFRPNTGGTIVPNNALGGGSISQGGMVVNVTGEFLQRGQDLLAVITLANQSKLRLQ